MESKLPISVCIISGAEAHRIGQALKSVAGWTSEIIVVLNEDVRDGTDKIAESFGAKVYREPWKGHKAQKNSALEKATNEWVLGLDADEAVSDELRDSIHSAFADRETITKCSGFYFPRMTFYCGRWIRHGDWYPDYQRRLARKDCARWGGVDPHDKLEVRGRMEKLSGDLHHFSNPTLNDQITKIVMFSDEFARQATLNNNRAGVVDLVLRPFWRFFRGYILRRGFLDGRAGFYIASLTAFATLTRYMKVIEAQQKNAK
jgi:glycosyltransferase involved in cell wall biosynthesis